jgi:hypothetical protein
MAHDVFISYAHDDRTVANAVAATLESHGIRCWIAPRDILPGSDWGEAILDAIKEAQAMVLIFSSHSNDSEQIKREVERTVHQGIAVIPFRIEDVVPSKTLEFFISTQHWLDALTPPLEEHLAHLAETITVLLAKKGGKGKIPPVGEKESASFQTRRPPEAQPWEDRPPVIPAQGPARKFPSIWHLSLVGFLAVLVIAGGIWWRWSKPVVSTKEVPAKLPSTAAPPAKPAAADFQKLNARVDSLKFFARQGEAFPPQNERVYKDRFVASRTGYLDWELNLKYPTTSGPVTFTIESTWYDPRGNVIDVFFTKHTIQADWSSSWHSSGIKVTDKWVPGTYRLVLKINNKEVASGSFQYVAGKFDLGHRKSRFSPNV